MGKQSKNTFAGGLIKAVHPSVQTPDTVRGMLNFRIIGNDNNSFVATNIRGNEEKGSLKPAYVAVINKTINGVAYIVSAEVAGSEFTGRGEIGTFPSPQAGEEGQLEYVYRPLKNYGGDANESPLLDGDFNSSHFNFSEKALLDIQLQNEYDGSINVIITDGRNPIRIVNSAFVVLPGNKYKRITRSGIQQSNKYSVDNWDNTLNLIARSNKLMKVGFNGVISGGKVKGGNYVYFFAYTTAEGNETEIVESSGVCSVFKGSVAGKIKGADGDGEDTDKQVLFTLSNLDTSYSYVRIYFTHAAGNEEVVTSAYMIDQLYTISGGTLNFSHSGYENLIRIDAAKLSLEASLIDTAETVEVIDNHLVLGNIKEKVFDYEALKKFSRLIKLGHIEKNLDIIGTEVGLTRIFNEAINQDNLVDDGWNGAYSNPKNIYNRTGYMGGEIYPFAVRFIFPGGYMSPGFPVTGMDNMDNNKTISSVTLAAAEAIEAGGGFENAARVLNTRGLYRFPNRNAAGAGDILSGNKITINGVTFSFMAPNGVDSILDYDLGGGKTIKDYTIGVQFVRAERRPDCITQGIAIDAEMIPFNDYLNGYNDQLKLFNYNGSTGFTTENSKLIPSFGHYIEARQKYTKTNSGGRDNEDESFNLLYFCELNALNRNVRTVYKQNPFAFISSEILSNPQKYSQLLTGDFAYHFLKKYSHRFEVPTKHGASSFADNFSLVKVEGVSVSGLVSSKVTGKGAYTFGHSATNIVNSLGFSSKAAFDFSNDEAYLRIEQSIADYLGITIPTEQGTIIGRNYSSGLPDSGAVILNKLNGTVSASFLVNIYKQSGQLTWDNIKNLYQNIDQFKYFPISGKMYWDDSITDSDPTNTLESKLDVNNKITLFGGDTFVNLNFRKLNHNSQLDTTANRSTGVRSGHVISFVSESQENIALRSTEINNINDLSESSFYPVTVEGTSVGDNKGIDNAWREYNKPESKLMNRGYAKTDSDKISLVLPPNFSYFQSHWFTRVWVSNSHVPNSYANGYRSFGALAYQDYHTGFGQLIKLVNLNGMLYGVFENGVGVIPFNERIAGGADQGGTVFFEAKDILSPNLRPISNEFGSRHKHSVLATDNQIYGFSDNRAVIWATQGQQADLISELALSPDLLKLMEPIRQSEINLLESDIVTTFDPFNKEVLFSFYHAPEGVIDEDRTFAVAFSEKQRKFIGQYGFAGYQFMNISGRLYSFPLNTSLNRKFYLHDSDAVPRGRFYNEDQAYKIRFVVRDEADFDKQFNNLLIASNNVLPKKIRYWVPGCYTEQVVNFAPNQIHLSNAKYKKGNAEIVIPKVGTVTDQDVDQYYSSVIYNAPASIANRARQQGKFMVVELEYDNIGSNKVIEIQSVITEFVTVI